MIRRKKNVKIIGGWMSLKNEQYNSLKMTHEFLMKILLIKSKNLRLSDMKEEASRCLRHYPFLDQNGKPIFSRL